MYLKEIKLINFRKFKEENNILNFVDIKSEEGKQSVNIATGTTLIIGKNNSGKTSIINAIEKLVSNGNFSENDFNYSYLFELYKKYENQDFSISPSIEIVISINTSKDDLTTNMNPFVPISIPITGNFDIKIPFKYELSDEEAFFHEVRLCLELHSDKDKVFKFKRFLDTLANAAFSRNYYDLNGEIAKGFKMKYLVEVKTIKANNIEGVNSLTKSFSKIVNYRYNNLIGDDKGEFDETIYGINKSLTESLDKHHTVDINDSLHKIESKEKMEISLSSDLNIEKLMMNSIIYEYLENGFHIPENQFGLGYTNLMTIIAEIIDYVEKYPEKAFTSKVNLICIEEPETYMHPQMEELFIKNINDAINSLLQGKGIEVNVQLIITSHSQHILNSKIHEGNSFNNINYINIVNNSAYVVQLSDNVILNKGNKKEDLNFIKKHIKYKVSELFFADGIIFVEGVTEETLLNYYLDMHSTLSKYYITVFNINGSHGKVYHDLIHLLKIPALIITDIDIKRSTIEKDNFSQVDSLKDRETTNETIKKYTGTYKIEGIKTPLITRNIYIAFQNRIGKYFPTSFEESVILLNSNKSVLNKSLNETIRNTYLSIHNGNNDNLVSNSFKLQKSLSSKKTLFSNTLLYNLSNLDDKSNELDLPIYISDGLKWMEKELVGTKDE
jgi:predicted ATP-dependent endonuclease of OLD family